MDWDNACVLEFIELLQSESAIWDSRNKSNKNRMAVNEAWQRIKDSFFLQCTVEELKRKRNSLMTAYREHLKKYKAWYGNGDKLNEAYKPTWFAFEPLHSFLGPLYKCQGTIKTEEQVNSHDKSQSRKVDMESGDDSQQSDCQSCTKRKRSANDTTIKPKSEDSNRRTEDTDENDLFGQILAQKLKKMNEMDRLMLTNEINNLVFKYEIKTRSTIMEQFPLTNPTESKMFNRASSSEYEP